MMVGVGGTSRTGKVHHYYKCGNSVHRKSCDKKAVRKAEIENKIISLTQKNMLNDRTIAKLADAIEKLQEKENTTLPYLHKQLDDVEKRIKNILNSIEEGLANASVKIRLDELETQKIDLEIAIAKEELKKNKLSKEQIIFWISNFKDGDIESMDYRRTIIDVFVNSVFLFDDKIVITFNWKSGTKTVTLKDVEKAAEVAGYDLSRSFKSSHLERHPPPPKCQAPARNYF